MLLVIPLFLQSFFLYRQEYEQKLADTRADLNMLIEERVAFIEEILQLNWEILEMDVKPFYIETIERPPSTGRFVIVDAAREALIVGIDTAGIEIPFTQLIKDLPRAYPVRFALLNDQKQVVWENQKSEKDSLVAQEPLQNTNLSLEMSVATRHIQGLHLQSYYWRIAALLFFVGGIGGGAVYLFTRRIARPLRQLCSTMDKVAVGASHARYTPDWMGFEINALGLQFNETLDGLLHHAKEAEKERLHREQLAQELKIGHEIQTSLLPKRVPGLAGLDIATGFLPAKEVNGDFYDLFKLPDGRLLMAMCDTAGKGISACLFALGLRSMLRALASTGLDLSELVQKANDLYCLDAHESSMFATLWIGIYDSATKTLTYCSQGHPAAFQIRGAQLEELWTEGIALGAQQMDQIPTKKVQFLKDDLLVLYTDGILEAHNMRQELFGKARFQDLLLRKQKMSAQQIVDQIFGEVKVFAAGVPQHDDMTLLVTRFF